MGREMQRAFTWHGTNDDFWVLQITFDTLDKNLGTSPLSLSLLPVKEAGLALSQQFLLSPRAGVGLESAGAEKGHRILKS